MDDGGASVAGAPAPPGPDPDGRAYDRALRRFRLARAAFVATGLVYLLVLTSGLPAPRVAPDEAAPGPATTAATTAATTVAASVVASTTSTAAAAAAPLTWDDVTSVPLGASEDLLRRAVSVCSIVTDQQVGDHTERAYSCKGAHAGSAARFTVVAGVVTQRATSNLRGERDTPTMTPEKFAKLSRGMAEADALAITGPCDLGVDQLVAGGRIASWTCYGEDDGFVVVVIEGGVIKELLDSLRT